MDFQRMQEDGFNIADVYIPWFIHEPEEGKFDLESLQKFLDLAHKHHIYVVARPGPYVNSESDQGAFPRCLSGKGVGFRRNTDLDRKWSKHWYDAIMPVLAKYQVTPGGPVADPALRAVHTGQRPIEVRRVSGAQQFSANIPVPSLDLPTVGVSLSKSWSLRRETVHYDCLFSPMITSGKDLRHPTKGNSSLTALQYSFPRPHAGELTAVWRAFMPQIRGLVYLNGVYMQYHEPGRTPNIGLDGIYRPPSMLKAENTLLFLAFDPIPPNLPTPVIRSEPDSVRKEAELVLDFAAPGTN